MAMMVVKAEGDCYRSKTIPMNLLWLKDKKNFIQYIICEYLYYLYFFNFLINNHH